MEEKNSCLDVEFIKAYLQSSIELETQKRIAEQTFNELLREENQWKQKMSYVAKKRYTKFSILDMLFMACKGFGISLVILYVIITIIEFADFNSILFEDILYFIWFIILAMLVVVIPIYRKITDYIDIKENSILDKQRETSIRQQANNALCIIQDNKGKLKRAYRCAVNNLTNTYSTNIIYKKYQTVEACALIYDYLESGRCYMLEGPYGAYNKYDDDLAKGIIIKKLEEIGSKMDMIIANQEKAYCVMQKIQKNVEEMECDMKNICQSLQDVDGKLNDIANNTKITAWASSVIATQVPDWKREAQDRANKTYI